MFKKFKYENVPLSQIRLDERNPRIVTADKLKTEDAIVEYFFEHENLLDFIKKIANQGKNPGAERPYIVKEGKGYVVIEGNTRIASYKVLTGELKPPAQYVGQIPNASKELISSLQSIDSSIAPSRDAMLPIMASAHFGVGDKSKWGYLGSRKAVYEEYVAGKTIKQIATAFDKGVAFIKDLILEYKLYLEALSLNWTNSERQELLNPSVEFNPPVRFLQSSGHKGSVGIEYDRANLTIKFTSEESRQKFKHLIKKLVVNPEKGLGATASYKEVFADFYFVPNTDPLVGEQGKPTPKSYNGSAKPTTSNNDGDSISGGSEGQHTPSDDVAKFDEDGEAEKSNAKPLKKGALFNYPVTNGNALQSQLLKEAAEINSAKYPAASTALLRSILESILKGIVDKNGANSSNKLLSLETALDICLQNTVSLSQDDKKILKEFKKNHLDYINLGVHATVIPNPTRLIAARDCIDQFVMRNI